MRIVLAVLILFALPASARFYTSGDGRDDIQNSNPRFSSALDIWPTSGELPTRDSLAEITIHRTRWFDQGVEQFNISAMTEDGRGAAYRFGVEREAPGQFRDILFCFENVTPGVASCQFRITPDGAYVKDANNQWRKL